MGIVLLHDPQATVDYAFNWVDYLATGETIAASSWRASSTTLTLSSPAASTFVTSVFVTGGTAGSIFKLINKITTDSTPARVDERVRVLRVEQR